MLEIKNLLSTFIDPISRSLSKGSDQSILPLLNFDDAELLIRRNPDLHKWVNNGCVVSDYAIWETCKILPKIVDGQRRIAHYYLDLDEDPFDDDYIVILNGMCNQILTDLQENEGKFFRGLIQKTHLWILDRIMGNEDFRDCLTSERQIEKAVTRAVILYMALEQTEITETSHRRSTDKKLLN